mgnify:CR=1 FL=1
MTSKRRAAVEMCTILLLLAVVQPSQNARGLMYSPRLALLETPYVSYLSDILFMWYRMKCLSDSKRISYNYKVEGQLHSCSFSFLQQYYIK